MTSIQVVILIISISMIVSVIYLIIGFYNNSTYMKINGFIMLCTPFVGPIYYFGALLINLISKKEKEIDYDSISFSKKRHNRILNPNTEMEVQTLPLEEIFLISSNSEKRKRLLSELKKDYISNYVTIVKALDNNDPETSHYAASAITSAKTNFENDIRELDNRYAKSNGDLELIRYYSGYVHGYLNSGILEPMEKKKYSIFFINILTSVENIEEFLTEQDYTNIVNVAIDIKDYNLAKHWAEFAHGIFENEATYLNLLKYYYYSKQSDLFTKTMDEMKRSDISLSHEGLSLVRFFIKQKSSN